MTIHVVIWTNMTLTLRKYKQCGKLQKCVSDGVEERLTANRWTRENRRSCWFHGGILFKQYLCNQQYPVRRCFVLRLQCRESYVDYTLNDY